MSTPFENIIDKALVVMRDYALDTILDTNHSTKKIKRLII